MITRIEPKDIPTIKDMMERCMAWHLQEDIPLLKYAIEQYTSYGFVDKKLFAFIITFDWDQLIEDKMLKQMFRPNKKSFAFYDKFFPRIIETAKKLPRTLYLLDMIVEPEYRRQGYASKLIDAILMEYRYRSFVGDVTCKESLPIYEKRGFEIEMFTEDYFLIYKKRVCEP
jgi:GNAT superfamily N-acetyltransferase